MTATEAAYLAGIIDGEGCIHARVKSGKTVVVALSVGMVHRPTIDWIATTTGGGRVAPYAKSKTGNYRRAWLVMFGAHRACDVLRQTLPFMVTKKREAELVIELMDLRAELSGGSRRRGMPSGAVGRPSKLSLAPEKQMDIINAIAAEKKRGFEKVS